MTYRRLPKTMFTDIAPTPVSQPEMVVFNDNLARELGLDLSVWKDTLLLSGNKLPASYTPIAMAYMGHQFGYLSVLGDGRAILLSEIVTKENQRFDIQLKGSGRTPYSRGGDGRAALGPMLREHLVSEAMHALGIPTSRSLAVVTSGETVYRERPYRGAILTRTASSHLRVGTLQYAAGRGVIREVAEYALERHDPQCATSEEPFHCMLSRIAARQAELIAQWQSVGFIHGVMNTDNMALSGETIDYGPCAFMDIYRANQRFSSIDQGGRYRYSNQPSIAKWNLARLAETLLPLLDRKKDAAIDKAMDVLSSFEEHYLCAWLRRFGEKLGLRDPKEEDRALLEEFLQRLEAEKLDFTNSFLALTDAPHTPLFQTEEGIHWQERWENRLAQEPSHAAAIDRMKKSNPRIIPRNHILEGVLEAAEEGDLQPFLTLLRLVQEPYAENIPEAYRLPAPEGVRVVTYCGT